MSNPSDEELFLFTKDTYGGEFNATLFDQYKLYVQSAENVSTRRVASSRYLLTVNAALAALYSFQSQNPGPPWLTLLVPVLGILVSLLWYQIITSHRNLNKIKFKIIHRLEKRLPAALYTHEWTLADQGRGKPYRSVTDIEKWIPLVFLALHLVLLVLLAANGLSTGTAPATG